MSEAIKAEREACAKSLEARANAVMLAGGEGARSAARQLRVAADDIRAGLHLEGDKT